MKMKIRYTKRRLRSYLIFGVIWLILGISAIAINPENIFGYGYWVIGALCFGAYLFESKQQYLTIENGIVSKNQLLPQKINLNEVKQVKKFAGDYILKTDSAELRIHTKRIEKESLGELEAVLEKIG